MGTFEDRHSPYQNFNFRVEIDGLEQANFSEVSGLGLDVNVADFRDASANTGYDKLHGIHKAGKIILKRGIIGTQSFYEWLAKCRAGKIKECKRNLVITLRGDDRKAQQVRWKLMNAMPVKYDVPSLNADGNDVAIEELVLSVEGVTLEGASRQKGQRS